MLTGLPQHKGCGMHTTPHMGCEWVGTCFVSPSLNPDARAVFVSLLAPLATAERRSLSRVHGLHGLDLHGVSVLWADQGTRRICAIRKMHVMHAPLYLPMHAAMQKR